MNAEKRSVAPISKELLERVLVLVGDQMILVGGQALAYWASYYGIPEPIAAVSKDADFIGVRGDVRRIAVGLKAAARYPHERMNTSVIGRVELDVSETEYVHIDVLRRVYGDVSVEAVRARSYEATRGTTAFRVMHPLDVLQGRLDNVHGLRDKQDEHGLEQLRLAVSTVRAFLLEPPEGDLAIQDQRILMKHVQRIERMALSDAGRKVARRYGIHVADALEFPGLLDHESSFATKKLPQLIGLMSASRVQELRDREGIQAEAMPTRVQRSTVRRSRR
jgi:hypothetical protein